MTANSSNSGSSPGYENQRRNRGFFGSIAGFFRWFWRNRRIQFIFIILVLSLPAFMIIYGIVLPAKNYKPTTGAESLADTAHSHSVSLNSDQLDEVRKIISLENDLAYQKNRLALAEKDSLYFILNIPDSSLVLEIKGVPVRTVRITELELSNRFGLISHENLLPWITEPFTLQGELSTIPKMPIVVKQAPKDTIEAAKSSGPLPPETTAVYFTLYFDRNLVVEIEQLEPPLEEDMEEVKSYRTQKRKESNRSVFQAMRDPQQSNQLLPVRIAIPAQDARAIYRAIPTKSHLLLRL